MDSAVWQGVSEVRESSSLLGPVDPSFRALSERFKSTVRRHKFKTESLSEAWMVWSSPAAVQAKAAAEKATDEEKAKSLGTPYGPRK
jgi:hypothetical protein